MRVGVHINRFGHSGSAPAPAAELAAAGAAAEAAGVSRLPVMDHYFQMEFNGGADEPVLEAYTAWPTSPPTPPRSGSARWSPA